jgi:selenophosphate synthetase-related protein
LALTAREIAEKSGLRAELFDIRIHKYRNLDNFLAAADEKNAARIKAVCKRCRCPVVEAGLLK